MAKKIGLDNKNLHKVDLLKKINKEEKAIKNRTTFRLSAQAKRQMSIRIMEDGYGMRGKSDWVSDTLKLFINPETWVLDVKGESPIEGWKRIVIDTELLREKLVVDAVNLTEDIRRMLWQSSIDAAIYGSKMDEPEYLDISSASVIRAAIMWRLSKESDVATVARK